MIVNPELAAIVTGGILAGLAALVFPELPRAVERLARGALRRAQWPSSGLDGICIGGGPGHRQLFTVFDPPLWKVSRWVWAAREAARGTATAKIRIYGRTVRAFEKRGSALPAIDSRRRTSRGD